MILSRVKARVRANSGWSSVNDVTTARVLEAINYIYTRKIPEDMDWKGNQAWTYIDLSEDDGDYSFADFLDASGGNDVSAQIRKLIPPAFITPSGDDSSRLIFTYDKDGFWEKWLPENSPDTGQPTDLLLDGENLFFRPVPDDSYVFKCWADWRPAVLTDDDDNDDVENGWEEALIAGASALLSEDDKNQDAVQYWWAIYENRLDDIISANQSHVPGRVKENW